MQILKNIYPMVNKFKNCRGIFTSSIKFNKTKTKHDKRRLPKQLTPLAWLEGTWRTVKAVMDHPKIKEPFLFDEVITFTNLGHKPLFFYTSIATKDKTLLHHEVGHLFIDDKKTVGLLAVHKFGCTTIEQGQLKKNNSIELYSCDIGSSKFIKKPLYGTYRLYALNSCGQLTYKLALASHPGHLIDHVWCTYEKREKCH
ncbi:uncharacterized protein LOC126884441 [Diabrotica virgifera virgifera]|uniref:Uncharacterized protein LOC114347476 n=1 Tax=Diabrotica virgifera virgifera TaxID=50390 RepID=A0A6P7HDZ0_DIAVI|nr:uncharacterized protein LOC126884441 [Diabrotica virgifera virgifera]